MKTLELKLKKDVFIVDINHFNRDGKLQLQEILNNHPDGYELLCDGSELTEEIASELVNETLMYEKHKVKCYRYRSYREGFVAFDNAVESFISAVESKGFYWLENPIEKPVNFDLWRKYGDYTQYGKILTENSLKWQEAEEKTFKNPLIFVKK